MRRAQPVVAPAEAVTPADAADPAVAPTPTPTPRRKGSSVAPGHAYPKPGSDAPVDPTPAADGQPASGSPAPAPAPASGDAGDNSGDIRIAPQMPGETQASPEDVQFNLANDFYKRAQYTQSAAEYERYLGQYPEGKQRQAAFWWLGESYRNLKRTSAARSAVRQPRHLVPGGGFRRSGVFPAGGDRLRREGLQNIARFFPAFGIAGEGGGRETDLALFRGNLPGATRPPRRDT